jgi:hypothetical protein
MKFGLNPTSMNLLHIRNLANMDPITGAIILFCSQLIKWNDPDHPYYTIRLAYYRSRCREDRWEFASQMTVNADPLIVKVLCERTLAKQSWFQKEPSGNSSATIKVTHYPNNGSIKYRNLVDLLRASGLTYEPG